MIRSPRECGRGGGRLFSALFGVNGEVDRGDLALFEVAVVIACRISSAGRSCPFRKRPGCSAASSAIDSSVVVLVEPGGRFAPWLLPPLSFGESWDRPMSAPGRSTRGIEGNGFSWFGFGLSRIPSVRTAADRSCSTSSSSQQRRPDRVSMRLSFGGRRRDSIQRSTGPRIKDRLNLMPRNGAAEVAVRFNCR